MDDLREEFIAETRETLQILSQQLVLWERTPDDHSLVDSVFRFVHTVKGSCGFLDLPRLLKLSHAAEEVLSAARDGNLAPSAELVTSVLKLIDRIAELTDALESGSPVQDNDGELIAAMLAFLPSSEKLPEISATTPIAAVDVEVESDEVAYRGRGRTVRVSLALLDKLMNGISDLVLSRNEVSRQLRRYDGSTDVENAFSRLSSSVAEMRDAIGQMRLQNIDKLFSSLPRTLRDTCVELNKNIDLIIVGNEVEVDREMAEAMRDPLTHIIRNAADHGIETTSDRLAAGKSITGRIQVAARQSGNQILVEISDDGRGIDVEKLGAKAIERKIYTHTQWMKLSDRAKLETIFLPGISTATAVSSISGRGVGMDVVRTNIHAIGGTIDLDNVEGRGLKVTLRLPLTLSIIAGISITAGGQCFGISRSSVVEILSVNSRNVVIEDVGGMRIAKVRNRRFAYATMESLLRRADKALYLAKENGRDQTCSLTNVDLLHEGRPKTASDAPANPLLYTSGFSAFVASEMVVFKLGGFVSDHKAVLLEVTTERVIMRIGRSSWLPSLRWTPPPPPVEIELIMAGLSDSRVKSGSQRLRISTKVRPQGWVRDSRVFQHRAQQLVRELKQYFVAE